MALGAKLNVTFQRIFLAFWNPLDPHNGNPFGLIYFFDILEFVDTLLHYTHVKKNTSDQKLNCRYIHIWIHFTTILYLLFFTSLE